VEYNATGTSAPQFLAAVSTRSKEEYVTMSIQDKIHPCCQCGYCCTVGPCQFGTWDGKNHRCMFLTGDNLCGLYDIIKDLPGARSNPAFGAGCPSIMFNQRRDKKLKEMEGKDELH
jgi:hypothetical protein